MNKVSIKPTEQFTSIVTQLRNNMNRTSTQKSVEWYKTSIKTMLASRAAPKKLQVGKMYLFYYQPKTKDLPIYDTFPLVIPLDVKQNEFMGLNLHYLFPEKRIVLLDKLLDYVRIQKDSIRIDASWKLLKNASKYKEIRPCIKHYLGEYIRSNFVEIEPKDWPAVCVLPVEKFNIPKIDVWEDSEKNASAIWTRSAREATRPFSDYIKPKVVLDGSK